MKTQKEKQETGFGSEEKIQRDNENDLKGEQEDSNKRAAEIEKQTALDIHETTMECFRETKITRNWKVVVSCQKKKKKKRSMSDMFIF